MSDDEAYEHEMDSEIPEDTPDEPEGASIEVQHENVAPYEPGEKSFDITPEKDGGVLKEIIREGTGEETPIAGDKVSVHYVGSLPDGTVFDTSRSRGKQFEFNLGKDEVIKAWDLGLATMKKGEVAKLYCKPEYAYGEAGSPPKIPPNATLVFEVELFSWKGDDLTTKKDGGIIRRLITKGEGYATPNDGSTVTVKLIGKHDGRVFDEREFQFELGEGSEHSIPSGIEKALQKFKKGEHSVIKLQPKYAFDEAGKPEFQIPPNAALEYDVTLTSFEKAKEAWELDLKEKIEHAAIFKTKGTDYFKAGKYELALKQYKRIGKFLDSELNLTEKEDDDGKAKSTSEEKESAKQFVLAGYLNVAACYLKLTEYADVVQACSKALEIDADNEKGLFRRGQALLAMKDYESAKQDFQAVLAIDKENKTALNQIKVCNSNIKLQKDKERKTYRNMFDRFAEQDKRKLKLQGGTMPQPENWTNPDNDGLDDILHLNTINDTNKSEI